MDLERGWFSLVRKVKVWNAAEQVTAADVGRAASKVEREEEEQLSALSQEAALEPSQHARAPTLAAAKAVEVDRLSFPPAPGFDPRPFLDRQLRLLV